jgi:hypothetical protein
MTKKGVLFIEDDVSPNFSPKVEVPPQRECPQAPTMSAIRAHVPKMHDQFNSTTFGETMGFSPNAMTDGEWKALCKHIPKYLGRLADEGQLVRVKQGVYRRPEELPETQPQDKYKPRQGRLKITDTHRRAVRESCRMDFTEAKGEPFQLLWPLQLHNLVKVYPGNIIVVGGAPDAGKTAFALNLILLNKENHQITYINSEMGGDEFVGRLHDFEQAHELPAETITESENVYFGECTCQVNTEEEMGKLKALIDPHGLNIIDYLEVEKDFYVIAAALRQIYSQLHGGLAIVFLQKASGAGKLRGGDFALQLPRVGIALDHHTRSGLCMLKFFKAKFPARQGRNPKKATIWYEVIDGAKLIRRPAPPVKNKKAPKAPSSKGEKTAKGKEATGS